MSTGPPFAPYILDKTRSIRTAVQFIKANLYSGEPIIDHSPTEVYTVSLNKQKGQGEPMILLTGGRSPRNQRYKHVLARRRFFPSVGSQKESKSPGSILLMSATVPLYICLVGLSSICVLPEYPT
ncbi:Uncharacterized protein Fot_32231 [Forsythia ovata]|uniref:Uncharacterized protein n=1 Tax=Forsythia ovata TaxID=205694 RepID=A0ABD1T799_9LAMI